MSYQFESYLIVSAPKFFGCATSGKQGFSPEVGFDGTFSTKCSISECLGKIRTGFRSANQIVHIEKTSYGLSTTKSFEHKEAHS
jgi:hypothetical protein